MRKVLKIREWIENKKSIALMKMLSEHLKRQSIVNPKTGEISLKSIPMDITQDIFIPSPGREPTLENWNQTSHGEKRIFTINIKP